LQEIESFHRVESANPFSSALLAPWAASKICPFGRVEGRLLGDTRGMAIQIKKGKALESLTLTPLIDVVFLLLIFFLVATQFAQDDEQLPIQLPSASNALPMTLEPDELLVAVGEDGSYAVRGRRVPLAEIERVVQQAVVDNPQRQTVIIRGDRRVPFQYVVALLDLMHRLRVPSYRIAAEDPETEKPPQP
jgi:biopolymer transport protein ExbD